ncbi:MAG: FAD-dependent oxidoreductase [Acidobacteriia bacterium]|nr:FAD-dependent oxidoreductase [Terriglobia bacterium]
MIRRQFLSAALVGLSPKTDGSISGAFVDGSHVTGHRLRDKPEGFGSPARREKVAVVIVGGGMAGLSAAWRLEKRGFRDFVILEMENQAGGNSRWGENEFTAYPWAAHYVPVPSKDAVLVRELMEELGLLRDGVWEERHLCHSPQERLFLHGRWQEGLEPDVGVSAADRRQYKRFHERMREFAASGEFQIPMEQGARKRADLDRLNMQQWMRQEGLDSTYLHWLVDYSCRDDFGSHARDTSAWAGIHYFAARGQSEEKGPLTWPEGNGWIVRRLLGKLGGFVRTGAFAHRILREGNRWRVLTREVEYQAEAVIFAAPTYLAPYVIEGSARAHGFQYSPWITANLTLDRWPREKRMEPAWDNVIYGSAGLGYVVATHQSLRTRIDQTVWTYYWALSDGAPAEQRQALLAKDWGWWKEAILTDLTRAHPDIRSCVRRLDLMRMGHAMIRPAPGFLFSAERKRWLAPQRNLFCANSDLSGFSLFEEAQYRGVHAADGALRLVSG